MNDMRDMRYMPDGRRMPPRNSRGEFMSRGRGRGRRGRRGDRGMDYGYDMRYDMRRQDYADMERGGNREGMHDSRDMNRGEDMRRYVDPRVDYRYEDMRRGDGHYMHGGRQGGYEPVEFMGYCSGYYGSPDRDYRGGRSDYGYDMRGSRDYDRDYNYRDFGDFGEILSDEELRRWEQKLMSQLDDRERQMFNKDAIMQKAKQMGKQMEGFGEKELYVATLMYYTNYKHTIGQNPDMAIKLAYDWLSDKDVAVRGAEKLAVYYDCIVEGE